MGPSSRKRAALVIQQAWQRTLLRLNWPESPAAALQHEAPPTRRQVLNARVLEHARHGVSKVFSGMREELRAGAFQLQAPSSALTTPSSVPVGAAASHGIVAQAPPPRVDRPKPPLPARMMSATGLVFDTFVDEGRGARSYQEQQASSCRAVNWTPAADARATDATRVGFS